MQDTAIATFIMYWCELQWMFYVITPYKITLFYFARYFVQFVNIKKVEFLYMCVEKLMSHDDQNG